MLRPNVKVTPFGAGLVLGFCAALLQAYFKIHPPLAYGFCMICHPGDLVNWVMNRIGHTHWVETFKTGPVLTVVGVLIGAFVAAMQHGELHLRPARQAAIYFIGGFLTVKFGQLLIGCPIRVVILAAYGSLAGLVGVISVIAGVVLGVTVVRWNAIRAAERSMAE